MGNIIILDEYTSNKIAAGEVIERPASVVKELVENSIDAGASSISVEIKNGGITFIRVTDNGSGIEQDDVRIAFERHATSKIRKPYDLESISTLGFRGEALASIASVAKVQLTTRVEKDPYGTYVEVEGGNIKGVRQAGCPVGTTLIVKDLFFNTPARYKFLKKDSTEAGYVSDIITRIALGNPHISFKLLNNSSTVIHTPGNNDLLSTIFSLYGKSIASKVSEINYEDEKVKIKGYAGNAEITRANRNYQSIYINGRYIKCKTITSAIDEAYKTIIMKNRYPFMVLKMEINPLLVDVNVHPAKMEVRFSNEQEIFRSVYHAVSNAVLSRNKIRDVKLRNWGNVEEKAKNDEKSRIEYKQQNLDINRYLKEEPKESKKDAPNINHEKNNLFKKTDNIVSPKKHCVKTDRSVLEKEADWEQMLNAKIIGQIFSTYIILQDSENMILVDQHAAHERIVFEKLKKKFDNNEPLSQLLIAPEVIEMTQQEIKLLEDNKEFFSKLGFEFENFGNNSIILRSIPYSDKGDAVKETFLEVVDNVMNSKSTDFKSNVEETLYTIACKAAVKANKKLDEAEIKNILQELNKLKNPFTCPHGRPTVIKIKKYEIEKKFKRVL